MPLWNKPVGGMTQTVLRPVGAGASELTQASARMSTIDHVISSSKIDRTDADVLKIFLKSYYQSNHKFPQTRCYFIVDFASRTEPAHLMRVLCQGVAVPQKTLQCLAKIATMHHENRHVTKSVTSDMIRADAGKMLGALKETYDNYVELKTNAACYVDFIADCSELKNSIDRDKLSPDYLDFVSPIQLDRSGATEVVRTRNSFLEDRLLNRFPDKSILMRALEKEITKPLWILRPVTGGTGR